MLYHNGFLARGDFFRRRRLRAGGGPTEGESPAADAAPAAGSWEKARRRPLSCGFC